MSLAIILCSLHIIDHDRRICYRQFQQCPGWKIQRTAHHSLRAPVRLSAPRLNGLPVIGIQIPKVGIVRRFQTTVKTLENLQFQIHLAPVRYERSALVTQPDKPTRI